MTTPGQAAGLSMLPGEILLHIISFLEPHQTTNLQLVSKGFRNLARDDNFWRSRCLQESTFIQAVEHSRLFRQKAVEPSALDSPQQGIVGSYPSSNSNIPIDDGAVGGTPATVLVRTHLPRSTEARERERVRIMANWDPSFPSEHVSWYEEYIQRHGPVVINWLEQSDIRDSSGTELLEARGVALYRPDSPQGNEDSCIETLLAVSPLDDGSVCLWDVNGTKGKRGAIVAKSRAGILFIDGPGADNSRRSKRVDSGVTECVSVDSHQHRAYFAVQGHLIEVDLRRLSVVGCESFPFSISALSAANPTVPLTVGTSLGIYLHDSRTRKTTRNDPFETIDDFDRMGANDFYQRTLRRIFDDEPLPPYAPLAQPGPLSILHLERPGLADLSDDIYVAGRFSNILHYDRRTFPSIKDTIYSGARLCSLASLPYPFSVLDNELRRRGQMSLDQVENSKTSAGGRTLIACGEYNTKGSLEVAQRAVRRGVHLCINARVR
ncbi:hypothetical protein B0H63DRAFT_22696 [Podospora didyma]|uniref:F-box domain-containing protein n=1 Tax=Podospora didyma TaxID=330526 RepID=A0AAE0P5J1_9PEZI|nr:hypothetical protein B0H63DRAFT_22696 [Podospora didyma]